jgi:hypothetical protein
MLMSVLAAMRLCAASPAAVAASAARVDMDLATYSRALCPAKKIPRGA